MKLVNIGCGSNYDNRWINLDLHPSKFVKHHNIKKSLPFPSQSVDVIYHSHVLEHLTKKEANNFIKDCFRVLKKGGIMRVVVPDLEQICIEYLKNLDKGFSTSDSKFIARYNWNKIEIFDQILRKKSGGEMLDSIVNKKIDSDYVIKRNGDELKSLLNITDTKNGLLKYKIINFLKHFRKSPQNSGEAHKWMYDKLDLKLLLEKFGFNNYNIVNYNDSLISNWTDYNLDKSKNGNMPRKPDSLFVEVIK